MTGGHRRKSGRRGWVGRLVARRHPAPASSEARARASHPASTTPDARRRRDAGDLTDEAQAFLDGRYAEHLSERSVWVPPWAWTNLLAHGSEDAVHGAAREIDGGVPATRGWQAARGYLATELLRTAGPDGSLHALQRDVLVPLELDLARRRDVAGWTPQHWVNVVRAALRESRHTHHV